VFYHFILKMKAVGSFEKSGTVYPVTQHHIPEDQKLYHSENLKTRKNTECITEVEKDQEDIKRTIPEVRYTALHIEEFAPVR
jgi:hypothetical protein